MARTQYGLEIHSGPFGIDSRPALITEKFAETQGKGKAFHDAVMHAYWQDARSIDRQDVLQEIATSVGLDTPPTPIWEHPEFDAEVTADIDLANEYGLNGVPALIFADKYLVSGAQPYDLLKQVVEKIQEEG